ncbi:hypothetical protein EYC98_18305 [Halieaceae bacterium IMCC14734]|uniref:Phytanoyl-CoA dioxygenase n=1 Tax=Candidatus Litorirhabdus singularis TaxID=2518993 RepID=A0ABT3TLE5_9GAMM|nr:hypothetical protein [Candidatus Litorirhabdus singularis]MCX2982819.1 hypothetical protein [Candidatus Litorirhabdus singularis]
MNATDTFAAIGDCILSSTATALEQQAALVEFTDLCTSIGGVQPDVCFDAWSGDSLLNSGVAISPQAAAHCVADVRRTVVYIRGLYAAICAAQIRFATAKTALDTEASSAPIPLRILYAGCGPYATLLLPLLHRFAPGTLQMVLLDIHEESLNSVQQLIASAGYAEHDLSLVRADACHYQHPDPLHLIVVETMQKALEQEPQVPITRQLAPQLVGEGVLVPQSIDVSLVLQREGELKRLGALLSLAANVDLTSVRVQIPTVAELQQWRAVLHTHITVFGEHQLGVGEAEITLARLFPELSPLVAGQCWDIAYKTGPYPCFEACLVGS